MSDLAATGVAATVGIVGVVSTFLTAQQGRRDMRRLADAERFQQRESARLSFYVDVITAARYVQRASVEWTLRPSDLSKQRFDDALNEFAMLVARARLTEPEDVANSVISFEDAFRSHRQGSSPQLSPDASEYRLGPLVELLGRQFPK